MKAFFGKVGKAIVDHKILTIVVALIMALVVVFSCLGAFVFNRYSTGKLPTDKDLNALKANGGVYEHVVIFGVDGAGGYFDLMDTPGFDSVFKGKLDASVTYTALSQYPTISAQNWGSMIHGVRCNKHKLTNEITEEKPYTDTKYPSFMKVYAERHPEEKLYSIVHWPNINIGIFEDLPQLTKINISEELGKTTLSSEEVSELVAERTVEVIKNEEPKVIFTHFDCVDSAGHGYGWGKPEYVSAIQRADKCIGMIYQACVEKGWENNTLFICISDHGHETFGGHGSNNYTVRNVTFAVAGGLGNVISGKPGHAVTQDMASVVLYALGEKQPESWDARVPKNMFKGL